MIKKCGVLAATALFALNASAGYVRYDLEGTVSGYFVQNDDDKNHRRLLAGGEQSE